MASLVFVVAFGDNAGPGAYVDALYFTVSTLTTTALAILPSPTPGGKLLSVFIMVAGVALFVQLARAIFQPSKVRYTCPECGLKPARPRLPIHCKHCGEPLKIETMHGSNLNTKALRARAITAASNAASAPPLFLQPRIQLDTQRSL